MSARVEITAKYARAYVGASKRDKSRILDQLLEVTGVHLGLDDPTTPDFEMEKTLPTS